MTTLLSLYPYSNDHGIKLYITGSSFGTVPAQILYAAPYVKFSFGRWISRLLTGVLTPFRHHNDCAKQITWWTYFLAGITYYVTFNLMSCLATFVLARKMATTEGAGVMWREDLLNRMGRCGGCLRGGMRDAGQYRRM
ncbi:hypothetical protein EDB19DRAFT_152597 [Suillus lakei]|nr:hypothetical protein EDB19DRAFT_152597 [Suillus lakei]